jgi:hypothetical protein
MASPLTIGTSSVLISGNPKRVDIRFQNNGATILYFKRQLTPSANLPSATNYDFALGVPAAGVTGIIETNSTSPFYVVSSAAAGVLAVYETIKTSKVL